MSYSFTDLDNKSKLWVVEAEDGITKKSMETKEEEEEEEEVVVDITTEEEEEVVVVDITTEKAEVDIMIIIMVTVITLRIIRETEAGVCTMFW